MTTNTLRKQHHTRCENGMLSQVPPTAAQPAPAQGPLSFNCSAGCGACGVKLQDFVTHQTQAQEGDEWVVVATQPQIVSTCCGSPVEVWDERKQDITANVDATPPASPAPEGMVLVPKRMTQAMRDVTDQEDWRWEDLLAAAEAITEDKYNEIATPLAQPAPSHPDDLAVDRFATAMKEKMAKARAKGRNGWNDPEKCPTERLQTMLAEHITRGDPVDVGNFAMMLWDRVESTAAQPSQKAIEWPNARDVGRYGDMSPSAHLRVGLDTDNDVYLSIWDENGGASIEFCTPGAGGGASPATRMALIALMLAIEQDNAQRPDKDWWAKRLKGSEA